MKIVILFECDNQQMNHYSLKKRISIIPIAQIFGDNGSEFAKHQKIAKQLNTKVYFTDPYSSWQKGTVENTNKLVRQYIPKKSSIKNLSFNDLTKIQLKINNRLQVPL